MGHLQFSKETRNLVAFGVASAGNDARSTDVFFDARTPNLIQPSYLILYVTLHNVEIFTHLLDDGPECAGFVFLVILRIELPFLRYSFYE